MRLCRPSVDHDGLAQTALEVFAEESDWRQIVRRLSDFEFNRLCRGGKDEEAGRIYMLLSTGATPALRTSMTELTVEDMDRYVSLYKALVEAVGRRIKVAEGQTEDSQFRLMASMLSAMVIGFVHESEVDQTLTQRFSYAGHGDAWSPFALSVVAVLEQMTEAVPPR